MPLTLPGRGDSPGITSCSRRNRPGCTTKPLLVPLWDGWPWTSPEANTFPPPAVVSSARKTVTVPLHVPDVRVTVLGEMRPVPKLVSSRRFTDPEKPLTTTPVGSLAVVVVVKATPAVWLFEILGNSRLW